MSSALGGGGLNNQRGNPLGNHVRILELDVAALKKQVAALMERGGGAAAPGSVGPAGPAGPAGPITYIAMPAGPMPTATPAPMPAPMHTVMVSE